MYTRHQRHVKDTGITFPFAPFFAFAFAFIGFETFIDTFITVAAFIDFIGVVALIGVVGALGDAAAPERSATRAGLAASRAGLLG